VKNIKHLRAVSVLIYLIVIYGFSFLAVPAQASPAQDMKVHFSLPVAPVKLPGLYGKVHQKKPVPAPVTAPSVPAPAIPKTSLKSSLPAEGLSSFLRSVVNNSPQLRGQQSLVASSSSGVSAARMAMLPTLTGNVGNMHSRLSGRNNSYNSYNLSLRQPLWAFGRIDDGIESARDSLSVAKNDFRRARIQVLSSAVSDYLEAVRLTRTLSFYQMDLDSHQGYLNQAMTRQKGGMGSSSEVSLARLRLLQSKSNFSDTASRLSIALNKLSIRAGHKITAIDDLRSLDEMLAQFLSRDYDASSDPELAYYRSKVNQAKSDSKSALSSLYPTIYFQADKGYIGGSINTPTRYGIVFEGNLSSGGAGYQRYRESVHRAESERYALEQQSRDRLLKVTELRTRVNNFQSNIKIAQSAVKASEDMLSSYKRQFKAGRKTWLEVLNFQKELTASRLSLIKAESNFNSSRFELVAILGGLNEIVEVSND